MQAAKVIDFLRVSLPGTVSARSIPLSPPLHRPELIWTPAGTSLRCRSVAEDDGS